MTCLDCGSVKVIRSQRKDWLERLMSCFAIYPFRCVICGFRFEAFSPYKWRKVKAAEL